MNLQGRIIQIMKKEKLRSYFLFHIPKEVRAKDIIIIERKDIPQKKMQRLWFSLKHIGREMTWWILVDDKEDLQEGDIIDAEVSVCYDNACYLIGRTIEKIEDNRFVKADNYQKKEQTIHA